MISAVILAKNEEEHIEKALNSVMFCDEMIVIDDESVDKTAQKAIQKGAKVVKKALVDFSDQRNYALNLAKHDWVLFIDADEIVSPDLALEIVNASETNVCDAYWVKREDILFGKKIKHGELLDKKFIRLARKNKGKWYGKVHESWDVRGKVGELYHPIIHTPHETLSEFISEVNFYTTLRAHELCEQKVSTNWFLILFFTKAKFFQTYILKLGFLDGMPGLILSIMMSLHTFLVRSKLWQLSKNQKSHE